MVSGFNPILHRTQESVLIIPQLTNQALVGSLSSTLLMRQHAILGLEEGNHIIFWSSNSALDSLILFHAEAMESSPVDVAIDFQLSSGTDILMHEIDVHIRVRAGMLRTQFQFW